MIIYRGPSMLEPDVTIVAILTGTDGKSLNPKTGGMAQLFIVREDVAPHEAVKAGLDSAVCGGCPLAGGNGCYVQTYHAPLSVWKCMKREGYPVWNGERFKVSLRSAAYGDNAALPKVINEWLAEHSTETGGTGYTHQWDNDSGSYLHTLCMASVHNITEMERAHAKGFRTFRTLKPGEQPTGKEIICPNVTHGIDCNTCGLCAGSRIKAKSIALPAHGSKKEKLFTL